MRCLKPISIRNPLWLEGDSSQPHWLAVPCGKCSACLSRRRQEWAFRLNEERKHSDSALFVTLTYDNCHLPLDKSGVAHVSKRDCQTFLKRLRKACSIKNDVSERKLRYYICSEYGSQTLRPHYHMLLFNFPIKRLDPYSTILKAWSHGLVQVGPLLDGGAAYAAKYILNPLDGVFCLGGRTKPFALMSRKPGLGLGYLTPNIKKYFDDNLTYLATISGGRRVPLPRYYRQKLFSPEILREISYDVVADALKDREEQFWKDIEKYGESREYERNNDYDRRVRNNLTKMNKISKL